MNKLKKLRLSKELTLRDLSEKTNVDYSTIAKIEKGERNFTEQTLIIFANFFNVSTDYLLNRTDEPRPETKIIEKIVTVPSQDNSNFSPEHRAVLDLISRLDRDDLIMLKGMILALLSSRPQEQQRNKDII